MVDSMSKLTLIVVAVFCSLFLLICVTITICICTGRTCFVFGGRHLIMARFALSAEDRRRARREALKRKLIARFKRQVKKERKIKATNTLDRFVKKHQVTCPICLDRYTDTSGQELATPPIIALLTKCGHHFHFHCVWRWLDKNITCPVCRRKLEVSESELKAVTLREIHNREVDNKSDISSIYVIDKGSIGDTMISVSDAFSDAGSYYSSYTNSNPRRTTTVTVSPRSVHHVHISPRSMSSPTSTLSGVDNHSIGSSHGTHSRNASGSHMETHSRNASGSHMGTHSRNASGSHMGTHSRNASGSHMGTHSINASGDLFETESGNPSGSQISANQNNSSSQNINQKCESQNISQTNTSNESLDQQSCDDSDVEQRNRAMTPVAEDSHVVHM